MSFLISYSNESVSEDIDPPFFTPFKAGSTDFKIFCRHIFMNSISPLILASAFPAILVFAQELIPGKFGMISGLFYGFSFGMGGMGAAVLGNVADHWGINSVYEICSFLPLLGLFAVFLPNIKTNTIKKT